MALLGLESAFVDSRGYGDACLGKLEPTYMAGEVEGGGVGKGVVGLSVKSVSDAVLRGVSVW